MKFLAIDTSGKRLVALAVRGENVAISDRECAMQHSVNLLPEVDGVLSRANLKLGDCDFLACTVGPGSFTGIRIGISAVKGMCFGAEKCALAVTTFDAIAYAEEAEDKIAVVDAGHGYLYAKGYGAAALEAGYYPASDVLALAERTNAILLSAEELAYSTKPVDLAAGLLNACRVLAPNAGSAEELAAMYLRKSNAEEGR